MKAYKILALIALLLSAILGISSLSLAKEYTVVVDEKYPHPSAAFTQGFIIKNGIILETSGLYGQSFIQNYTVGNKLAPQKKMLAGHYFAEGLTKLNNEIFVLTWKENTVLVLNSDDYSIKRKMRNPNRGWGLTTDDEVLITSDGSATISFRQPTDFSLLKSITVTDNGKAVKFINELEWIRGEIYANVWQQDLIVVINPNTGLVTKKIDLSPLRKYATQGVDVLNGIAWDKDKEQLYLTGKHWAWIFAVSIIEK